MKKSFMYSLIGLSMCIPFIFYGGNVLNINSSRIKKKSKQAKGKLINSTAKSQQETLNNYPWIQANSYIFPTQGGATFVCETQAENPPRTPGEPPVPFRTVTSIYNTGHRGAYFYEVAPDGTPVKIGWYDKSFSDHESFDSVQDDYYLASVKSITKQPPYLGRTLYYQSNCNHKVYLDGQFYPFTEHTSATTENP